MNDKMLKIYGIVILIFSFSMLFIGNSELRIIMAPIGGVIFGVGIAKGLK